MTDQDRFYRAAHRILRGVVIAVVVLIGLSAIFVILNVVGPHSAVHP